MWKRFSIILNLLTGGEKEQFCTRVYRCSWYCMYWKTAELIINLVLLPWGKNHCFKMWEKED